MRTTNRHTYLSHLLFFVMWVILVWLLVAMYASDRSQESNVRRDERFVPIPKSRFRRPTFPTFQPFAGNVNIYKGFKASPFLNDGWKRLEVVGNEPNFPTISNQVGRWKPRQLRKVGRLDGLVGFSCNHG
jgi:hypothetical protein